MKSGGQQIDDMLNSPVGFVVGAFEFAVWLVSGIRLVMESAVGQGTTQTFVEEQKQKCDLDALCR